MSRSPHHLLKGLPLVIILTIGYACVSRAQKATYESAGSTYHFEGSSYFISTISVDHSTAKAACEGRGGQLVAINSPDEDTFIQTDLSSHDYWIGATRPDSNQDPYWFDGSNMTYTQFGANSYNDGGRCIRMKKDNYKWHDNECSNKYRFICEMKAGSLQVVRECNDDQDYRSVQLFCPTGYTISIVSASCTAAKKCHDVDQSTSASCNVSFDLTFCTGLDICSLPRIGCTEMDEIGSCPENRKSSHLTIQYYCNQTDAATPTPVVHANHTTQGNNTESFYGCEHEVQHKPECNAGSVLAIISANCHKVHDCSSVYDGLSKLCRGNSTREYRETCDGMTSCDLPCRPDETICEGGDEVSEVVYECISTATSGAGTIGVTTITSQPTGSTTTTATTTTSSPSTTYASSPLTSSSQPPSTPPMSSSQPPSTPSWTSTASQTTSNLSTTPAQIPFEEFLTNCFENSTGGETNVKPFRPLSFSSPAEGDEPRIAIHIESEFLQSLPVKLELEAFQDPKPSCGESTAEGANSSSTSSGTAKPLAINSVANLSVFCFNGAPLQLHDGEYVDVVFPAKIDFDSEVPVCTSMSISATGWEWSTDYCASVYANFTHVTCRCTQLAAIALQLRPKTFHIKGIHATVLGLLKKITGLGSALAVLVMVMTFATTGVRGTQVTKIQLNIALAVGLSHFLFVFGINATGNVFVCTAISAVLQYLYTVYACWLVVLTAVLLRTCYIHSKPRETALVSVSAPQKEVTELVGLTRVFVVIWALPAVVVGMLYKNHPHAFGTPESCWLLETGTPFDLFIATTTIALAVNGLLVVATKMYYKRLELLCMENEDGDDYDDWVINLGILLRLCLPSSVILSAVLFMTWIFHLLREENSFLALDYMFQISNGCQGVLVFWFYCVKNPEVRSSFFRQDRNDGQDDREEKEGE